MPALRPVLLALARAHRDRRCARLTYMVRLTGARSTKQALEDLESLTDLSLAATYGEYELLLQVEGDRIWIDRAMQLQDVPAFSLREGASGACGAAPVREGGRRGGRRGDARGW